MHRMIAGGVRDGKATGQSPKSEQRPSRDFLKLEIYRAKALQGGASHRVIEGERGELGQLGSLSPALSPPCPALQVRGPGPIHPFHHQMQLESSHHGPTLAPPLSSGFCPSLPAGPSPASVWVGTIQPFLPGPVPPYSTPLIHLVQSESPLRARPPRPGPALRPRPRLGHAPSAF